MSESIYPPGTNSVDELHLRRLTADEAVTRLDKFIHDAFIAGLTQVKIVHGKGSGTLREMVRRELKKHPLIKAFRPGLPGEGSQGVTIVELAER